jgi:parvulin-like peptidyl-prolyl isomerase
MIVPIILVALIGFLATIIFQWGMDISSRDQYLQENLAGKINGEEISWGQYNQIFNSLYQAETQDIDDELPDSKVIELQQAAWQQIIYDRLLMQEAAKYNISVSSQELYSYFRLTPPQELQQAPVFQTDGKFDYQKYVNALADPNFAGLWNQFQPIAQNQITIYKLQDMIVQTVHVTDEETKNLFIDEQEKIKVGFLNVDYATFSDSIPIATPEEMTAYYEANRDNYQVEERAILNVVKFSKEPKQYDWDSRYALAKEVYDSLMAGGDFTELAEFYSDDVTRSDGGNLGWFIEGIMVPEFDSAVFSLQEGQISEPVKTVYGWHIIKNRGFKETFEVPLGGTKKENVRKVQASHILFKVDISGESLDQDFNKLEEFRIKAEEIGFFEAAEHFGYTAEATAPFLKEGNIQFIGAFTPASNFAFDNDIGTVSSVMENSASQFVIQVAEKLEPGIAEFADVEQKVGLDLLREKLIAKCNSAAEEIYSAIEGGTPFRNAGKKYYIEYDETELFTRTSFVKGLRRDPDAIGTAFSLKEIGEYSKPVQYENGTVLIKLLNRIPADLTLFATAKDSIQQVILFAKQQQLYSNWFQKLVENSEIVSNIQTGLARRDNY